MENKIGCLILVLLIATSVFSQNKEDRYVKLSQFESKEFLEKPLESGNSYLIHQNNGDVQSLEIRKYKSKKKHGEWLTFLKTVGSIDLVNVCNYNKGLKNGYFFDTDNHTYIEEGYYKDGEKHDIWTKKTYSDMNMVEKTTYNKGKKCGEYSFKETINDKTKTIRGFYKQDKKHGIWVTKDEFLTIIKDDGLEAPSLKKEYYKKGELIKTE